MNSDGAGAGAPSPWFGRTASSLLLILAAGVFLRLVYVARPLDGRIGGAPWRESDYVQIARNFLRDDSSILYPRIDWRGDTPGYTEMELPLLPYVAARIYRLFGPNEVILRALSCGLEIGSLMLFAGLSRRLLPPAGALFATAAYALNPLLIYLSTAMQPEALMGFFALLSVVLLLRWSETGGTARLLLACACLGGAILAKAPAASLGPLFAFIVLRRQGASALRRMAVWGGALLALAPPAAWYLWSHRFFALYGNSLGLSNESALFGLDLLFPPWFLLGLLKWETLCVFMPTGWLLLFAALKSPQSKALEPVVAWQLSVWGFYLATARTTADGWAFYYHAQSCAPGALLMGAGFAAVLAGGPFGRRPIWPARQRRLVAGLLAAGTIAGSLVVLATLVLRRDENPDLHRMYDCAQEFKDDVPEEASIVVRGGVMFDDHQRPVAHNESMLFAWMDRRGFSYGDEELSLAALETIAARGGRFWLAPHSTLHNDTPLAAAARERFRRVAVCSEGYDLYDLTSAPVAAPGRRSGDGEPVL